MKDVQKELLAISTALSSLVVKVEKMVEAIETEGGATAPVTTAKKVKAKTKAKPKKKAPAKKAPAVEANASTSGAQPTMLENIYTMISRSRNGITVERLKKRTGLEARQVSNALYKLTKKGKIETLSRGVYVKKKS